MGWSAYSGPFGYYPSQEAFQSALESWAGEITDPSAKKSIQDYYAKLREQQIKENPSITNYWNIDQNGLFYLLLLAMWKSEKGKDIVGKILLEIVQKSGDSLKAYCAVPKTDDNYIEQYGCSKLLAQFLTRWGMISKDQYDEFNISLTYTTTAAIAVDSLQAISGSLGSIFGSIGNAFKGVTPK